jgi:hypothetical protein
MPRGKVVKYDYYEFMKALGRAGDTGTRIDQSDRARWTQYVKEHGINEVAATAIATQTYESVTPVILAEGRDTDGLYFYSKDDEGCLRLVAIE